MANREKTSLLDELKTLLGKDERFIADGQLLKNTIVEHGLKLDKDLIRLLLSNNRLKEHFFADIDGTLVFDKDKFIAFVDNKQFLPDSYTAFKNKIGLTLDGKDDYLKERKDVVLVWPYKDCVLEGGQTKEDQKRDEIFWNETLAPDEIDRLFEPKVLTNFKRFDKNGEHKVDNFKTDENGDIKDNLIIKGNNLLALHSLKKKFAGKVKLIYIDPPYNTGNDSFNYNDNFNHSTWLTFMKNRLEVSREMLTDNGAIFIQIDDTEAAYLRVLLDSVFGRENYISQVAWQRSPVAGLGQGGKLMVNVTENILCYAKDKRLFTANESYLFKKDYSIEKLLTGYRSILKNKGKKELICMFRSKSNNETVKIFKHSNYEIENISLKDESYRKIISFYKENFDKVFRTFLIQKENQFQHRLVSKMDKNCLYSVEYIPSRGKRKNRKITNYYYNRELFGWLSDVAFINDST